MLDELLHAVGVPGNKILVVEVFRHDDVGYGQKKGHIGTRFYRMPLMGKGGCLRKPGIQDNQLASVFHGGHHVDTVRGHQGLKPVGARHDDIFGIQHIRERDDAEGIQKGPVSAEQTVGLMGKNII